MAKKSANARAKGKTRAGKGAPRAKARAAKTQKTKTQATKKKAGARTARPPAAQTARAAQVAERERPGWSAVPPRAAAKTAADVAKSDASAPELRQLKAKYFGVDAVDHAAAPTDDTDIVQMQPKTPGADLRPGRKASVVQKDRVIGHQG